MTKSEFARWFAGHMGIHVVLINALIDRGIFTRDELEGRFQQALDAALKSEGGVESATVIASLVDYLHERGDRLRQPTS